YQRPAIISAGPFLGASIFASAPSLGDDIGNLSVSGFPPCICVRGAAAQQLPQVRAVCRIQAPIPHPIRGYAAAIAGPAKWRSRGGDDAEDCAIRQQKS